MSKRITKAVRAAFNEQIATMKRNEEAAGLWCICGHSSPTHDSGFTCQSVACDCLNFRPSNADTWCQCSHSKYNHGEDDFSLQECNVIGCDCDDFTCVNEPPVPRAGERDVAYLALAYLVCDGIVNSDKYYPPDIAAWARDLMVNEQRVGITLIREAIKRHNQHATLVAQRERLIRALTLVRDSFWSENEPLDERIDYLQNLAKETLATIEREGVS